MDFLTSMESKYRLKINIVKFFIHKRMLLPKRTKFRKVHRGRIKGKSNSTICFGDFGLQASEPAWITSRQIEATRRSLIRSVRRVGKIWIRVFPDKPITERAAESRMGAGKGQVNFWVAVVKPRMVVIEISGLAPTVARSVLREASHKLPLTLKIVSR
jgi:large subunit ribosomal protein L16